MTILIFKSLFIFTGVLFVSKSAPDEGRERQQFAEGEGDKAHSCRCGWWTTGHQLQQLLRLFICGPVERKHICYHH